MKKAILLIPILFLLISMVISCKKTCMCAHYMNGEKLTSDVEMEQYESNCEDQSDKYTPNTVVDSLGNELTLPDEIPHVICN